MEGHDNTNTVNIALKEDAIIKEGAKAFFAGYSLGKRIAMASIYNASDVLSSTHSENLTEKELASSTQKENSEIPNLQSKK